MIGLLPFMAPAYAVVIAIAIYFGLKVFVGRRKKMIEASVGNGLCVDCGEKIINNKCPVCDKSK